jgi:hypothetical protein
MRVAVNELVPVREPQMSVKHEQILVMFLRPGSIEPGFRRSEMARLTYDAGEMLLCHRHVQRWIRTDEPQVLSLARWGFLMSPWRAASRRSSTLRECSARSWVPAPQNIAGSSLLPLLPPSIYDSPPEATRTRSGSQLHPDFARSLTLIALSLITVRSMGRSDPSDAVFVLKNSARLGPEAQIQAQLHFRDVVHWLNCQIRRIVRAVGQG